MSGSHSTRPSRCPGLADGRPYHREGRVECPELVEGLSLRPPHHGEQVEHQTVKPGLADRPSNGSRLSSGPLPCLPCPIFISRQPARIPVPECIGYTSSSRPTAPTTSVSATTCLNACASTDLASAASTRMTMNSRGWFIVKHRIPSPRPFGESTSSSAGRGLRRRH
jgi:hypothetical protein